MMPRRLLRRAVAIVFVAALAAGCGGGSPIGMGTTMELRNDWRIAAADSVDAAGAEISSEDFDVSGWTTTSVPSTPMAALVRSGAIEKPYFARNLESVPADQFTGPWWYRTRFQVDDPDTAGARLEFDGINYSAEVWLNGERIAGRADLVGAFRTFSLDVDGHLVEGTNVLAVLVWPPEPGDPTIGFVDWNPMSPDVNMGLWRPVRLRLQRGLAIDDVFVRSGLDPDTHTAAVTIDVAVRNALDEETEAVVTAHISGGIEVTATRTLAPGSETTVRLSPEDQAALAIANPKLWWPNGLGEPNLYDLTLEVAVDGQVADRRDVTFGIRHVDDYLNEQGHRGYSVNGRNVLIRGGGWVDDLMLEEDERKIEDQLRYVRHMGLNTIRLEGFWGNTQALYDLADRLGIMVMVGWSCQWEWENYLGTPADDFGGIATPEQMDLVSRSLADQVRLLRNHPSVVVWVLASDKLPRPQLERRYNEQLAGIDTTRPVLSTCSTRVSEVSGPTGVKMNGPYDWVPPNYWYVDTERGGAYGFNTETGPGPQPPPAASIRRMLPEKHWWPPDEMWDYHSGRNEFNSIDRYEAALAARYGTPENLDDFARWAQVANYEAMRAMFESFAIRQPVTTGLIQWMLNSAWPEFYWQLYDYYLVPNGAFYGVRDSTRSINIAYDYADGSVVVVNERDAPLEGATARVTVYGLDSAVLFADSLEVGIGGNPVQRLLTLPEFADAPGGAYFVDLRLEGRASGHTVDLASSLYWLPTRPDVLDWDASTWFVTPVAEYADLAGLRDLPAADLDVEHTIEPTADGYVVDVTLINPTDRLAFFVELSVSGDITGQLAAPVYWSDNYVSLMPGETRIVRGEIPAHALTGEEPVFHYSGINVAGE